MFGKIFRSSPFNLCAVVLIAFFFTSTVPCSGAERAEVDGSLVVGESTVGYAIEGPRPVISIKPGEKLVLGAAPKNIPIDLKDKTVVVKDANLNVVSFDTLALRDNVTVYRKDKKVYIHIVPKPKELPPS